MEQLYYFTARIFILELACMSDGLLATFLMFAQKEELMNHMQMMVQLTGCHCRHRLPLASNWHALLASDTLRYQRVRILFTRWTP